MDAIVTDPPYGLEFMGKEWDRLGDVRKANRGTLDNMVNPNGKQKFRTRAPAFDLSLSSTHAMQDWHYRWAVAALRVAKPGAHLLAFGGTRTFHRLACAIEDAGWEIRDCVMWAYGSGFPKSHDVSKAIDKAAGAEREVVGVRKVPGMARTNVEQGAQTRTKYEFPETSDEPITAAAKQWNGWGTALKPAWEPIIVARKPVEGTVAANVLKWGTGAMNIDGCRIATKGNDAKAMARCNTAGSGRLHPRERMYSGPANGTGPLDTTHGRWPANLIHDGSEEVLAGFPAARSAYPDRQDLADAYAGTETPVKGVTHFGGNRAGLSRSDSGSAARFFYCAKASRAEREAGCEGLEAEAMHPIEDATISTQSNRRCVKCGMVKFGQPHCECDAPEWVETAGSKSRNTHPTVKPVALMRYLCRLVTPPGGIVLDPFMGSGSTGIAALEEDFRFLGIEIDPGYFEIAKKRIEEAQLQMRLPLGE